MKSIFAVVGLVGAFWFALPLERAAEAHRRLEGRATTGKLVLRTQS